MSDLQRLEELTSRPYPLEPPRRSLRVEAALTLVRLGRRHPLVTPHLHHGTDVDKVHYEYDTAWYFWSMVDAWVAPSALAEKDVLDVGCGWGGKCIWLAERSGLRSITGFDLPGVFDPAVPTAYARDRGLTRCTFTTGYAEEIPFDDASFDVALLDDVLEHVSDPERTLAECRRILRPGGIVVVKFPSIKMLLAHHLDRAINYPGLHWVAPLRTWAAGLNYHLLYGGNPCAFEPFARTGPSRYHKCVTANLNGLDLRSFHGVAEASGLHIRTLELLPYAKAARKGRAVKGIYEGLRSLPRLRERLSDSILFVGER